MRPAPAQLFFPSSLHYTNAHNQPGEYIMDQDTLKISMAITLLAAYISYGHVARAESGAETGSETSTAQPEISGSVARSAFTLAVVDREPTDEITTLSNDHGRIYYFTELDGMAGQKVSHRWLYNGQTMAELTFNVGGPRWRVWSSKSLLPNWTGEWSVAVINEQGQEVSRQSFEYVPAAAAQ